jgi:hypothetical protein
VNEIHETKYLLTQIQHAIYLNLYVRRKLHYKNKLQTRRFFLRIQLVALNVESNWNAQLVLI